MEEELAWKPPKELLQAETRSIATLEKCRKKAASKHEGLVEQVAKVEQQLWEQNARIVELDDRKTKT